jgi:hypothetical protein
MALLDLFTGLAQEEDGDFTWGVCYLVKWMFRGLACGDSVLVASGPMRFKDFMVKFVWWRELRVKRFSWIQWCRGSGERSQ